MKAVYSLQGAFTFIFSIYSINPLEWVGHYEPHFTDEKTEAQGGYMQLTEA